MNAIQGTVSEGRIVLDDPIALSEGTRVEVLPIQGRHPALGMREEDWPTTREGIAALLARMDEAGSSWLAPEDDAVWRAALDKQTKTEKARFTEGSERFRGMWE